MLEIIRNNNNEYRKCIYKHSLTIAIILLHALRLFFSLFQKPTRIEL
jgi:hypothetical protein